MTLPGFAIDSVHHMMQYIGATVSIKKRTVGALDIYGQAPISFSATNVSLTAYFEHIEYDETQGLAGPNENPTARIYVSRKHLLASFPASSPSDAVSVADRVVYDSKTYRVVSVKETGRVENVPQVWIYDLIKMEDA